MKLALKQHMKKSSFRHNIFFFFVVFLIVISGVGTIFSSSTISNFPRSKLVLAYYYGWYTKDAWYNGANSFSAAFIPSLGLYNSSSVK